MCRSGSNELHRPMGVDRHGGHSSFHNTPVWGSSRGRANVCFPNRKYRRINNKEPLGKYSKGSLIRVYGDTLVIPPFLRSKHVVVYLPFQCRCNRPLSTGLFSEWCSLPCFSLFLKLGHWTAESICRVVNTASMQIRSEVKFIPWFLVKFL